VARAGQFFQYHAAQVLSPTGEAVDSVRPGIEVEVKREALGVIGIITPLELSGGSRCLENSTGPCLW